MAERDFVSSRPSSNERLTYENGVFLSLASLAGALSVLPCDYYNSTVFSGRT